MPHFTQRSTNSSGKGKRKHFRINFNKKVFLFFCVNVPIFPKTYFIFNVHNLFRFKKETKKMSTKNTKYK